MPRLLIVNQDCLKKVFIKNRYLSKNQGEQRSGMNPLDKLKDLSQFPDVNEDLRLPTFSTSGLNKLRETIKETFLPLLIHIFQLKSAKQDKNPFSSLEKGHYKSEEDVLKQLEALQEDLKQLSLWTSSCLSQVEKALHPSEPSTTFSATSNKPHASSRLNFSRLFSSPPSSSSSVHSVLNRLRPNDPKELKTKSTVSRFFTLAFRPFSRT